MYDHIVAQIVKTKLIVGSVGNIGPVVFAALGIVQTVYNHAHAKAQILIDFSHPVAVTLGEIVVDRYDMHAFAGQGIQIGRQRGNQRFSFSGAHLGDTPLVQYNTAHQLDRIRFHAQHAPGGFPNKRKCFRQKRIQCLALLITRLEFRRLVLHLLGGKLLHLRLQRFDLLYDRIDFFYFAGGRVPEKIS